jgi:hypothetical protein
MAFVEKVPEKLNELVQDAAGVLNRWSYYRKAQQDGDARTTAFFQNPILPTCNWDLGCDYARAISSKCPSRRKNDRG